MAPTEIYTSVHTLSLHDALPIFSEIFTASTLSSCAAGLRLSNGRGAELLARRQARARAFPRALVSSRQQEAPYERAAGSQASGIDVHRLRGGRPGQERRAEPAAPGTPTHHLRRPLGQDRKDIM